MGTSLAAQWFRLCTCTLHCMGRGFDPWSRPKSEKKKKKKNCRKQRPSLGMGPRFVSDPCLELCDCGQATSPRAACSLTRSCGQAPRVKPVSPRQITDRKAEAPQQSDWAGDVQRPVPQPLQPSCWKWCFFPPVPSGSLAKSPASRSSWGRGVGVKGWGLGGGHPMGSTQT